MTEIMPAGLLLLISQGLGGVSDSSAGQFITAYAIEAMTAAIPVMKITQGVRRRGLLLVATGGFAVVNLVTALRHIRGFDHCAVLRRRLWRHRLVTPRRLCSTHLALSPSRASDCGIRVRRDSGAGGGYTLENSPRRGNRLAGRLWSDRRYCLVVDTLSVRRPA